MTTEGKQQEAVCGTCGHLETSHLGRGANYQRGMCYMRDCDCVSFTPAPVVPSDERCEVCGETERYPGTDLLRHQHVRPFGEGTDDHDFAPPTPSQDAEGDGWWVDSYCNKHNGYHLQHGDDGTDYVLKSIESANEACRALNEQESSIRADYEELVKAAQRIKAARTFDLGWRGEGAPPRCIEIPAIVWNEFITALIRIEESHQ